MRGIKSALTSKNIETGYLYFYIHFVTELICFFVLSKYVGGSAFIWIVFLMYDSLAFVPQSLYGYLSDKYPKIPMTLIGMFLLIIAVLIYPLNINKYIALIILCIGNAFIHINGAEVTLRAAEGKLSHSSIFVSGGSFGVICGKLLGNCAISNILVVILALTIIPFALFAESFRFDKTGKQKKCINFDYNNKNISSYLIILLSVFVVIVRSYMGYGIPTSWNKTVVEMVLLYFAMGIGKALGGVLIDSYGIRKVAFASIAGALPFLVFGDKIMIISLIGVMLFSMTMAVTLGLLVSVLNETPGLAFGLTTIGLFLGTLPVFFFQFTSVLLNSIILSILTMFSLVIMHFILRREE